MYDLVGSVYGLLFFKGAANELVDLYSWECDQLYWVFNPLFLRGGAAKLGDLFWGCDQYLWVFNLLSSEGGAQEFIEF